MTNLDNIRQMNSEELAEILDASVVKCKNCTYKDDYSCKRENCISEIKKWLEQEATPTLSDDEKVILRNIDKKYKWIARDKNNVLYCYISKPHKTISENWTNDNNLRNLTLFNHLFQFIQWSDVEPYEISALLGDETNGER